MKAYTKEQLERFDSHGYKVIPLFGNLVLIRKYSKNANRLIAHFPLYSIHKKK